MKRSSLLLLLAMGVALSACGKDEPEPEQHEKNFGAGVAQGYKDMMNEARQSAEQANQHTQETEQRSHPDQ